MDNQQLLDLSSESDSDHEVEVLLLAALGVREHRFWTADYIRRRDNMGEFNLFFELDDERFQNYFRMSRQQFSEVQDKISASVSGINTNYRKCIPVDMKLAVCLRFLATGDTFRTISYSFRLGEKTVARIVEDVTEALWIHLQPEVLNPPSTEQWKAVGSDFEERWQFPNCLGAIDGKHVTIKAPPQSGSGFFNYKKTFSIVLLAVVDANYQFLVVDVGSSGRFSDGGIFASSAFGSHLRNGSLGIPEDKPICSGGREMPYVFVADEAFPLQTHIMRPFPSYRLVPETRVFNYRLSRARRIVENAFGILAVRWRVYKRPFECKLQTVDSVVKATCVLHNFLGQNTGHSSVSEEDIARSRQETDNQLNDLPRTRSNASREAFLIRELFVNYFNYVNRVAWQ